VDEGWPARNALKSSERGSTCDQGAAQEANTNNLPAENGRLENGRLLKFGELERVECFLPWEKDAEKEDPVVVVHC